MGSPPRHLIGITLSDDKLFIATDCSRGAIRVHQRRRMNVEGIGEAHEEIEQGTVVDRLRNLRIGPAHVAELLHLGIRDAVGMLGQRADELQQAALGRGDGGTVQIASAECLRRLRVVLALQLQEPCMTTQSIMTVVERRHIGRDHLVLSPAERTIREVEGRGIADRR